MTIGDATFKNKLNVFLRPKFKRNRAHFSLMDIKIQLLVLNIDQNGVAVAANVFIIKETRETASAIT